MEGLLERRPEQDRILRGQAALSLILGLGCWLLVLLGGWALSASGGSQPRPELRNLGYLLVLASFLPALFGVGQGAAAVRGPQKRLRLALGGLILSGAHLGILIGLLLFNTMHN